MSATDSVVCVVTLNREGRVCFGFPRYVTDHALMFAVIIEDAMACLDKISPRQAGGSPGHALASPPARGTECEGSSPSQSVR